MLDVVVAVEIVLGVVVVVEFGAVEVVVPSGPGIIPAVVEKSDVEEIVDIDDVLVVVAAVVVVIGIISFSSISCISFVVFVQSWVTFVSSLHTLVFSLYDARSHSGIL